MTYPNMGSMSRRGYRVSGHSIRSRASTIVAALMALGSVFNPAGNSALADEIDNSASIGAPDSWKLAHVRMNHDGTDIFTLSHVFDFTRSDPGIAGLTILCDKDGLRTAVVVIEPFPPRSHPRVTVAGDDSNLSFDADVIPPGAQLLLSLDIRHMLEGPWSRSRELTVKITDGDQTLNGVVTLVGIKAGLTALLEDCNR